MDLKEVTDESSSSLSPPIHPTLFALDSIFFPLLFPQSVCVFFVGRREPEDRERQGGEIYMDDNDDDDDDEVVLMWRVELRTLQMQ